MATPVRGRWAAPALPLALLLALPNPAPTDERDKLKVGLQPDGRVVVPTNQILKPAGTQATFPGRPVDLALADGGRVLVAKNMRDLVFLDPGTGAIRQTLPLPAAAKGLAGAFSAVGLAVAGDRVLATDSQGAVRVARPDAGGKYGWAAAFPLKPPATGVAYPTGIALRGDTHAWVCSSRGNELQLLNLDDGVVEARVPVGVAPYLPLVVGEKVYVTNWGGDRVKDAPLTTSGTPVRTDPRTDVANTGTVSVVERAGEDWKQTASIPVGGHPCGMAAGPGGKFLYVANANSDTVSVIATAKNAVVETIDCKPDARLPFGTGSNAVALSPNGRTLYVANGTGNCVAVVELGSMSGGDPTADEPRPSRVAGLIPTGWYPGAVRLSADGKRLFVANVKGHGALSPRKAAAPKKADPKAKGDGDDPAAPQNRGKNSHDHLGSVSLLDVPDAGALKAFTETATANNRLGYAVAGMEKPRPGAKPVPVPDRHGEPSVFEHVIYVIKENRTYDQVFGDMKEGNGDPALCIFGEEVTPNHHKLAREFTLLDNFYCSGVLSADGHSWVTAAYATDYLEKQFGQFTRSYPYEGSDTELR